ncbi:alanine dehydrogenase [Flavobacterium akiainvivens]|uniref:Alanine dehydrogenase n=1 Tax=Flavobacterium akiainvivens TaxID=1202724 RepID=A0A0M8M963_9FLAO|nr:XdhC/CoxI family protein [Flavobacterium akiainvivens]KOS05125.1 alanine dehydrogenase [Flavobacterium akiainvivens]SFQ51393.1 Xanthine and CO dehydrogenase maturation factor, XdhC/CoxF family [Flavobacterium akiainvivens]
MKEISDIITAYHTAHGLGIKTALATVVKVEGSSYRQPGARMLVTEEGLLTGAISGGCLEGDALRKALLCINQQQNKLITYDTSNEDDVEFGVQLGCNGIVHILFEYIDEAVENNPIRFLEKLREERKDAVITTVYSLDRKQQQTGTALFYREGNIAGNNNAALQLLTDAQAVLMSKASAIKQLAGGDEALMEYIAPPLQLVVAGAGNDVQPLVSAASLIGWEVTVGDGRATHALPQRFREATCVFQVKPDELVQRVTIDENTCFVLMTHNYKYDLALLKLLLETSVPYIGILGPKTKLNRMLDDLQQEGITVTEEQLNRIYGPVGLDIGAETSEEIAISIVAEIKAVMSGKTGASLKYKTQKIHDTIVLQ